MIIKQTQKAIDFYKLAIENAQNVLEFQVNQDEKYQEFISKYKKIGINTLFYAHSQDFGFYSHEDNSEIKKYFKISDGEIVNEKDFKFLVSGKDISYELLSIVKKFYE